MLKILKVATIASLLVTSATCLISYNIRSSECAYMTAQQRASTGYAVNWGKALDTELARPVPAMMTMAELEQRYPPSCDSNTSNDLTNCLLIGLITFLIIFVPIAGLRAVYSLVTEKHT